MDPPVAPDPSSSQSNNQSNIQSNNQSNNTSDDTPSSKSIWHRIKNGFKPDSAKEVAVEPAAQPIPYSQLFAYANRQEYIMTAIALVAALCHGTLLPLFTIVFGSVIDNFNVGESEAERQMLVDDIGSKAKWFLILGAIAFVTSLIQVRFQLVVSHRIGNRLRTLYFNSLMTQDYTWYDANDGGELTTRVAGDVNLIEAGIGEKLASAVQFLTQFIVGFIIAFVHGWKLTFIILAIAPLLAAGGALFAKQAADSTSVSQGAYGAAGAVANEVLSLVRTVTAYNGQQTEAARYERHLEDAYKAGVKKAVFSGIALGFTYFTIFCSFSVAFAFGASEVRAGRMNPGDIIVTFFSVFIATLSIGQAAPAFTAFQVARGAAPRVYEIIRRPSQIDPLDPDQGRILDTIKGDVTFSNVVFNYPSRVVDDLEDGNVRPHVLEHFNINIASGQNHALVGKSGCGKSTTVRLMERFYDVSEGEVTIDGVDIRELNVRWLRSQIGYVGQMPTLFMLTIRQNIALGAAMNVTIDEATGKKSLVRKDVTEDDIREAAKKANAHDFIMKLPEQYNTMLGERGALLSGGQKQRICIARALVRNPRILLLDESTSALDGQSERVVQEALEKASAGRTTVTIAHRLSTIKNADIISVIDKGTVVESGKHTQLLGIEDGAYKTLVEHQNVQALKQEQQQTVGEGQGNGTAFVAQDSTTKGASVSKSKVDDEEGDGKDEKTKDIDKGVTRRAFKLNRAEIPVILLGMVGAAIAGASFPSMAVAFAEVIDVVLKFEPGVSDEGQNVRDVRKWALIFVAIGGASFIGYFLQYAALGWSGQRLTKKLRSLSFRALLKQEMGFFDKEINSVGNLTTRLATESTMVEGLTGTTLGGIALVTSTILTGFLIAFLSCWRIALVVMAIFPLMAVSEATNIRMMQGFDSDSKTKFAAAGAVATEAVDNFDTVNAIGVQDVFIDRYGKELEGPLRNGQRAALMSGFAFGFAEFLSQALWAISFWVGSVFIGNSQCEFVEMMKGIAGLLFAGSSLGQASLFLPDVGKSKTAATSIFRLIDAASGIDPTSEHGEEVGSSGLSGEVEAKEVKFEYPSRPDVAVLRGLNVKVNPGQTLALVGESGSGKSTVVSLIERFYDVRSGSLLVDGKDSREYEVKSLRQHIGLVSQEPDLFNRSVRDNIAYGLKHEDGTVVTESMIVEAAKLANAHEFISELPDGYDCEVGPRGSKLSGGQRQRVAIARSLIRSPQVLVLDEATSALDSVSEHVVQQALDKAAKGRTTIAIAHRLSTIKDADMIAVIKNGKVAESGTHDELLRVNGAYALLVRNQMSEVV